MASQKALIKKLQMAINRSGDRILYSTYQFYSDDQDRTITVFQLKKSIYDVNKGKNVTVDLFSSTNMLYILLFLRDYWYEMNGTPIPDDNEDWKKAKEQYYAKQAKKLEKEDKKKNG